MKPTPDEDDNIEYTLNDAGRINPHRRSTGEATDKNILNNPPPTTIDYIGTYVLTGIFTQKPRTECAKLIVERGGNPQKHVTTATDYLVVGDEENAEWKHGNYGNKIANALDFREKYGHLKIISAATLLNSPHAAQTKWVSAEDARKQEPALLIAWLGINDNHLVGLGVWEIWNVLESQVFSDDIAVRELERKKIAWKFERFRLHPEIFAALKPDFIKEKMPESLHRSVRLRVKHCSKILTKKIIGEVITKLNDEDAAWWVNGNRFDVFYKTLAKMYSGCCDGESIDHN